MKPSPKVGQTLYQSPNKETVVPVIVTQVGRKYFKASPNGEKGWQETQYELENWQEVAEYGCASKIYETEQDCKDENEFNDLIKYFYRFDEKAKKLSLPTLRNIRELIFRELGEETKEK